MSQSEKQASQAEALLDTPDLADVLDGKQFKQLLDRVPLAIAVSHLRPTERISYANPEFERVTGVSEATLKGKGWEAALGSVAIPANAQRLAAAIVSNDDHFGAYTVGLIDAQTSVDVWSNVIIDSGGSPLYRLVALTNVPPDVERDELERKLHQKDLLLRELQHRVSNNLQMITALIRMEARSAGSDDRVRQFDRLAGRVNALAVLYRSLSDAPAEDSVDLGAYLSEIASAVMRAHSSEGIRLDLKVDSWPCYVNVAMPTGLVVNELLTNALKHAFAGRDGGTISLHSLVDEKGCKVIIADDGIGLAEPNHWPKRDGLGALIVQSLKENANAKVDVQSESGGGLRVTISFDRENAAPHE
jgi:two-component sensor histidine kinase